MPTQRLRATCAPALKLVSDGYSADLSPEGQAHLDQVVRSSIRIERLLVDLLQLAKIANQELQPVEVDLVELGREVAGDLQREAPGRKLSWIWPDAPLIGLRASAEGPRTPPPKRPPLRPLGCEQPPCPQDRQPP